MISKLLVEARMSAGRRHEFWGYSRHIRIRRLIIRLVRPNSTLGGGCKRPNVEDKSNFTTCTHSSSNTDPKRSPPADRRPPKLQGRPQPPNIVPAER